MIYAFTDFGSQDIYVGQLKAALLHYAPGIQQIDLLHDAPCFDVQSGAHLLHALVNQLPTIEGDVFFAVVDPGVGSMRRPVAMQTDGVWFVGPDNGLLSVIAQRARHCSYWEIEWRPESLSASFHGRDLFTPVAARLAVGDLPGDALKALDGLDVMLDAGELNKIIYLDHYGNAMTGIRSLTVGQDAKVRLKGKTLAHARVFCEAPSKEAFWYENSLGLVEIAVNGGSAAEILGLKVGELVELVIA